MAENAPDFNPPVNGTTPHPPDVAGTEVPWTPLDLVLQEDDAFFCTQLPRLVKTDKFGPHDGIAWQPRVLERIYALGDGDFTSLILQLAEFDYLGLNLLFDERILPRCATIKPAHLLGTFLNHARTLPGFAKVEQEWRQLVTHAAKAQRTKALRQTARQILATQHPPLTFVVEDVLPAGCTLMTGKSKDGKSLMAYDIAVAVASGGKALGHFDVTAGSVWYLALEDGERRAKERLQLMEDRAETALPDEAQDRLVFTLWEAPRLGEGLEEDLLEWIGTTPDARLIIIDILEKVRPSRKIGGSVYAEDYASTSSLTRLAQEMGIAILVVHHSNKSNPADFRDSASGAMSLLGGADNYWSVSRKALGNEATLSVTGRDILHPQELQLSFQDGWWSIIPDDPAGIQQMHEERRRLLMAVAASPEPLTPRAVADQLGKNRSTTRVMIHKLVRQGFLVAMAGDTYTVSAHIRGQMPDVHMPVNGINTINTINGIDSVNTQEDTGGPVYRDSPPVYGGEDTHKHPQASDNGERNGKAFTPFTTFTDPGMIIPCAVCGETERWNDRGTQRCVRCWPKTNP